MNIKSVIENFKFDPLNSDPKLIKYLKLIRSFIKFWKRRIFLFFVIFLITLTFQYFLYDLVKDSVYYNTIILFLTIVTFFGIFFPTYFRKDISKKDVVDSINEEHKKEKEKKALELGIKIMTVSDLEKMLK